jgi:UDP-N-acetylglucosamine--N-acetylmuramyl-(pentapeptide) pyrophosphoryl-undecaprenol N-acetylglucosamine transferase
VKPKIIISGGGTGGHIFPAIAIANVLRDKYNAEILFVGAQDRMEMEKVPQYGYPIEGLWISGIQRRVTLKNLSFPFKVWSSLIKSKKIIQKFRPDVAVGVGGYASGPLLYQAAKMGIPTLIQEQNSYPGITNKILAKKVDVICVAYSNMERFFPKEKIVFTGNPIRKEIIEIEGKRHKAANFFGLKDEKITVLSMGGSLGALSINEAIYNHLDYFKNNDVQLIWQTGKTFFEKAKSKVTDLQISNVKVFDFIQKMDYAYAMADVVISRAGALSLSELMVVEKTAILVPSPYVAEDHQTKNAMALVNHNAALLVKNNETQEKLIETLDSLINDKEKLQQLSDNIKGLGIKDADELIAQQVIGLIRR